MSQVETVASDDTWRHDAALKLFDHIESQVRLADQKAGLIFAADSILLAGYVSLLNGNLLNTFQMGLKILVMVSAGFAATAVVTAILYLLHSINPVSRCDPYDQFQIFFKQIADPTRNADARAYERNFLSLTRDEFTGQLLRSIHGKSDWASKKLGQINIAVNCTIFSVCAAAAAVLLSFVGRF